MNKKVIVIGDGVIGSNYVYSLMIHGSVNEIGIIDQNQEKVQGDVLDLADVDLDTRATKIYAAEFSDCVDADLVVLVTDISRYSSSALFGPSNNNLHEFTKTLNAIISSGFNGIFLVAADTVDILTYETWRITGFSRERIIGLGSMVSTVRLKYELAYELKINDPRQINIYMLGNSGSEEFAAYSTATVRKSPLNIWLHDQQICEDQLFEIEDRVKQKSRLIIKKKRSLAYGVAAALTQITRAIFNDQDTVLPVSICLEGEYGISNVCLATPAIVNSDGIKRVIELPLSNSENEKMLQAAKLSKGKILEEWMGVSTSYF